MPSANLSEDFGPALARFESLSNQPGSDFQPALTSLRILALVSVRTEHSVDYQSAITRISHPLGISTRRMQFIS